MSWVWTRVGTVGLISAFVLFATAWFVYTASPRRLQNRLMSILLAVTGITAGTSFGLLYLTDDPNLARTWAYVGIVFNLITFCFYAAFLSTLPTPLARPLVLLRPIFYVAAALMPFVVLATRGSIVAGVTPVSYAPYEIDPAPNAYYAAAIGFFMGILGLVLSIGSFRRAPRGTLLRDQARAYMIAFLVVDCTLVFTAIFATLVFKFAGGERGLLRFGEFINLSQTIATIVWVLLLAYGMVTTQLFDLQLKLKRGAGRTAVIALMAATFFVVSYVAETLLPVDGFIPGLIGAGLLAAAFVPLRRLAVRMLDRIFPEVQETPAYVQHRKEAVYAAAFEELARDGHISDADRTQLEKLRVRLGLPEASPTS